MKGRREDREERKRDRDREKERELMRGKKERMVITRLYVNKIKYF